jgi:hypothetical protein
MQTQMPMKYSGLNNKFYSDDRTKTFERRTRGKNWEPDASIYSSSKLERYKDDPNNPIMLALLEEEQMLKKAKEFKRTTPAETFADHHYDPDYRPNYAGRRLVSEE